VVPILKGSFLFAADLIRHIDLDLSVEFLGLRSYGAGTESSGVVQITYDLTQSVTGQRRARRRGHRRYRPLHALPAGEPRHPQPRSVKLCSLLHKPARTRVKVPIDYLGFTIEDRFVVGYGLDYAEKYRNLPYIGVIEN
jgi:hypoxanthine phosphoribosyltransferase